MHVVKRTQKNVYSPRPPLTKEFGTFYYVAEY
jgi:hypothetical protein